MALTFSGILNTVKPVETYQTKNGDSIKSREVVISTVEQYPQVASFTLRNDLAENFNIAEGSIVTVHFELKGRYNQNADRVFNELRAWKIEKGGRG